MKGRILFFLVISLYWGKSWGQARQLDSAQLNYDTLVSKIAENQSNYRTLGTRAKLVWDDGKSEQDFQASIRLKKDSIVWMSLSGALNVEGARLFLSPDTFRLINKISNEYIVHDFNYLENWLLQFPVSFKMLQQIISGAKIDIHERASMASYQDSMFVLYCETDKMLEKIWVNTGNYTISKILLKDKLLTQQMTVTFDGYNQLQGKPFSYKRSIEINRDGLIMKLDIDFTKVRLNEELAYPFDVSDKYKREK